MLVFRLLWTYDVDVEPLAGFLFQYLLFCVFQDALKRPVHGG